MSPQGEESDSTYLECLIPAVTLCKLAQEGKIPGQRSDGIGVPTGE